MSQQKAQLISPIDTFTPPGINVTGAGIITATSFVGSGGTVTGLADSSNLNVGVVTATSFYGDGSNLDGVAAAGYVGQTTAAQSGTTTIDLSAGNVIYFTQDTDTTVAFASTESVQELFFIRTKDDTTTARTITWPESITWNGGTAPTLIDSSQAGEVQIFNLTTRDQGVTWYGYEAMKNDPAEPVTFYMIGDNSSGSLGQNDTVKRSSPIQIGGSNEWTDIWMHSTSSYGVKTDGTFWVWGQNNIGQLGTNDKVVYSSPIQLPGTQWDASSAGDGGGGAGDMMGITKTDGTLWIWGKNGNGQLGLNDKVHRSSPVQVPGTSWSGWRAGNDRCSWMLKTDETLWVMGYLYSGMSGLNEFNIYRSSPVQLPGNQWSDWTGASNFSMGRKTDGTLWSWGYNSNGCGAQNTSNVSYSSPRQVGSDTQWGQICAGGNTQAGALKTDGTLWVWGHGGNGELGQNDLVARSSPVQVPGTWSHMSMSFNNYTVMAVKTDSTLWGWGENYNNGTFGTIPRSSPYQIGGTGWSTVEMGISQAVIRQG